MVCGQNYEAFADDRLAVIRVKENFFNVVTSRREIAHLEKVLDQFQYDSKIKALLIANETGSLGDDVYDDFINKLAIDFEADDSYDVPQFCDKDLRFREHMLLNELVGYLSNYKKLCFTLLSGEIVTPFFGASLTSDIRYATPEMCFSLAHKKYGLHPSGGLPYFLVLQIGYNKAMELMLREKISAQEALNLGIINKIIEGNNPIQVVTDEIKELISIRSCTLRRTMQLAAFTRRSLSDYFNYEDTLLNY